MAEGIKRSLKLTSTSTTYQMVQVGADGSVTIGQADMHNRASGEEYFCVLDFKAPEEWAGHRILTVQEDRKPIRQFHFSPESKAVDEITGSARGSRVLSTSWTYMDLCDDRESFQYQTLDLARLNGRDCILLEVRPANKRVERESGYGLQLTWIDANTYEPQLIEFFDPEGNHIKSLTMMDYVVVDPNEPGTRRPRRMQLTDYQRSVTEIYTMLEVDNSPDFAADFFTEDGFDEIARNR